MKNTPRILCTGRVTDGAIRITNHSETIQCPVCSLIQQALVEHIAPFPMYTHWCSCGYCITESEWNTVETLATMDEKECKPLLGADPDNF